jgi:hypothetical protein
MGRYQLETRPYVNQLYLVLTMSRGDPGENQRKQAEFLSHTSLGPKLLHERADSERPLPSPRSGTQ